MGAIRACRLEAATAANATRNAVIRSWIIMLENYHGMWASVTLHLHCLRHPMTLASI